MEEALCILAFNRYFLTFILARIRFFCQIQSYMYIIFMYNKLVTVFILAVMRLSLSMVVLNSRDRLEIIWLAENFLL